MIMGTKSPRTEEPAAERPHVSARPANRAIIAWLADLVGSLGLDPSKVGIMTVTNLTGDHTESGLLISTEALPHRGSPVDPRIDEYLPNGI
jgi:hypothetical protein